eukprot:9765714-Alexandrium_andersonii.AAC.1
MSSSNREHALFPAGKANTGLTGNGAVESELKARHHLPPLAGDRQVGQLAGQKALHPRAEAV